MSMFNLLEDLQQDNVSFTQIQHMLCQHFQNKTDLAKELMKEFNDSVIEDLCGSGHGKTREKIDIYNIEKEMDSEFSMILTIGIVAFVLGMFCNISLLLVIRNNRKVMKPAWLYVANLAVADILTLVSLVGFLLYIYYEPPSWPQAVHVYLFPSLDIFLASVSMLSVTAIAMERAFSMLMWKPGRLTVWNTKYVITSIWVYSLSMLVFASMRMVIDENKTFNSVVFWLASGVALFGCLTLTITCYICAIVFYLKRSRCGQRVFNSSTVFHLLTEESQITKTERERLLKKALVFLVVPLPFITGWSFVLGIQTYEIITGNMFDNVRLNEAMIIAPWIVSAFNPILYACLTTGLRRKLCDAYAECLVAVPSHRSEATHLNVNESLV